MFLFRQIWRRMYLADHTRPTISVHCSPKIVARVRLPKTPKENADLLKVDCYTQKKNRTTFYTELPAFNKTLTF